MCVESGGGAGTRPVVEKSAGDVPPVIIFMYLFSSHVNFFNFPPISK